MPSILPSAISLLIPVHAPSPDLGRYSDRYRPEEQTAPSITNIKLQEDVFPAGLWKSFMEGEERREKAKGEHRRLLELSAAESC